MTEPRRTAGLDTLRACAILMVFTYHYMCFVSGERTFGWVSEIGWAGVDLFFVLSGYLIANQLFKGTASGRTLSPVRFYARRALRTLPVFWLVLAAYRLLPALLGGDPPPPLWRFLTFTQNLGLRPGTAFSHAWSLCIEEQFYLVLPLVLLAGAALPRLTRWHGWALMAALTALGIVSRIVLWRTYGPKSGGQTEGYYTAVYYATLCRFDEFLPGVAIALLRNFHRPAWERLMAHGKRLLAAGGVATGAMLVVAFQDRWITGFGYGFFMSAFGYTLLALAFALLVAAALSPATALHRARVPGAASLALWSYSIYLSHRPVANALKVWLTPLGVSDRTRLAVICVACLIAGALLHKLVEAPFMALRDRWWPDNFAAPRTPPAAAGLTRS
jgi:peptidoglycan/LPS O-acetylase OafA/YrhL